MQLEVLFLPNISTSLYKEGPISLENYSLKTRKLEFNGANNFFLFPLEISFLARLVHKIKIVKFSWNWVSTLIRIYRIQSWFSFFCLKPDVPFLGKFSLNNKILNLSWNLVLRLIRIWRIQWWCLFFFCFWPEVFFF